LLKQKKRKLGKFVMEASEMWEFGNEIADLTMGYEIIPVEVNLSTLEMNIHNHL